MGKIDLKILLKDKIPQEYFHLIPSSYDLIGSRSGSVAVFRIEDELEPYEKEIALAIKSIHKNVKAVIRRFDQRKGEFRLYDYKIILGEDTEVIHKEYGYTIKVDPLKVYFSPRDAEDRIDIAKSVKAGERILYPFSGVAPYAVAICKFNPNIEKIIAIEKNEIAHKYALENVKLNKLSDKIVCILGDFKDKANDFVNFADRVLMTLPLGAYEYLEYAFKTIKKEGGIIHFYHIGPESDPFSEALEIIQKKTQEAGYQFNILNKKIVNEYAPRKYKVRIDFFCRE